MTKDNLEDQPAQAALAANLQHPEYVRVVCSSLDNLATAFAKLDEQAIERATPLSRNNRDSALLRRVRTLVKMTLRPSPPKITTVKSTLAQLKSDAILRQPHEYPQYFFFECSENLLSYVLTKSPAGGHGACDRLPLRNTHARL